MLLFGLAPQVSVDILLQKAEAMFPEGIGAPKAFVRDGPAAVITNGLLENGHDAIVKLWERRGYDPKKPNVIKARLGYALDKYEATARLVLGAAHLPALLPSEAWTIGKRIVNIVGNSGSIGSQLKVLRKRGKVTAPQVTALLRAKAALNLDPPPRADPPPDPSPEPTPTPPAPEPAPAPLPPPTAPLFDNGDRTRYKHPYWIREAWPSTAGRWSDDSIPGYRGTPGGDEEENYWKPEAPPCVPSDFRPPHIFGSKEAAEAAGAAERMEAEMLPDGIDLDRDVDWEGWYDEDADELARLKYKQAMRRLLHAFPELNPCPILAHASQYATRPCPCGRGALAKWPWVVQQDHLGFCDCWMASWEIQCWRSEWIKAGPRR